MANSERVLPALIALQLVWYIKYFHLKKNGLDKYITATCVRFWVDDI